MARRLRYVRQSRATMQGGAMPVMLILIALHIVQGLTPAAGALFALPVAADPDSADVSAIIERATPR
ncbi:hypothetical protein [Cupriavidus numazuensis]|nr:hypothetical protein [Cupriavidus numazuensis]